MIILSFIILGHPEWHKANIKIFETCEPDKIGETRKRMDELVLTGRLPITSKSIEIIPEMKDVNIKSLINKKSVEAGLTILGFRGEHLKKERENAFVGYDDLGTVLFVNSHNQKEID